MLGFFVSPEEMKIFLEELREQLERFETLVVNLEGDPNQDAVKELFRITHTVKGSAASVGHDSMANLAHSLESVLDGLRQERIQVSREMIDLLFQCLDMLKAFKKDLEQGTPKHVSIEHLQSALETFTKKEDKPVIKESEVTNVNLHPGENLYELKIGFSPDCEMPAVRAYQCLIELRKSGEIIKSVPSMLELETGIEKFKTFLVILKSRVDLEVIRVTIEKISEVSEVLIHTTTVESVTKEPKLKVDVTKELKQTRTVRVDVDIFDNLMNLVGELVIDKARLTRLGGEVESSAEGNVLGERILDTTLHISKITTELQQQIMKARLVPIETIFSKFPRVVRSLASQSGKEIDFAVSGGRTQLDRSLIEEISDPLIHLLRNAVDHGIESPAERKAKNKSPRGTIELVAFHEENHVIIQLKDDGGGIDAELVKKRALERNIVSVEETEIMSKMQLIELIFIPGFSTSDEITDVSGRGFGMDIVRERVLKIGGTVEIETFKDVGTTFILKIPLTVAILHGLLVECNAAVYVIPLNQVREIIQMPFYAIKSIAGHEVCVLRGNVISLTWLGEFFGESFPKDKSDYKIIVVSREGKEVGIVVDHFLGKQEVVIKTIGEYIGDLPGIAGATVLSDGQVGLVLDVETFFHVINQTRRAVVKVS